MEDDAVPFFFCGSAPDFQAHEGGAGVIERSTCGVWTQLRLNSNGDTWGGKSVGTWMQFATVSHNRGTDATMKWRNFRLRHDESKFQAGKPVANFENDPRPAGVVIAAARRTTTRSVIAVESLGFGTRLKRCQRCHQIQIAKKEPRTIVLGRSEQNNTSAKAAATQHAA